MKYALLFLFMTTLSFSYGQGVVSEQANANGYYGLFGKPSTTNGPIFSAARYLQVSRNSLQTSGNFLFPQEPLRLNPNGGNVQIGYELNRPNISGLADLLPFAYGKIYETAIGASTNNFTMTHYPTGGTKITFNDTSIAAASLTIVVTPQSKVTGEFTLTGYSQAEVNSGFQSGASHEFEVFIYSNGGGSPVINPVFSFVAYRN